MIKLENTNVLGWEAAIRGMRNPMNSWEKSDSHWCIGRSEKCSGCQYEPEDEYDPCYLYTSGHTAGHVYVIGPNDQKLMMNLAKAGSVDAKYRRMIVVTVDITAPLYWWKEFDTYKVGTVANSCSTMHKIHSKEFTLEDFSCEHLCNTASLYLSDIIGCLNFYRGVYNSFDEKASDPNWFKSFVEDYGLQTKKDIWWQMIQLLPSSYNQRRTVMLNYEVLAGIYPKRKDHKLDEWHDFYEWIKSLPYPKIITLEETKRSF